ncbi:MAG: C4-type zinc ribbon domain-containing protein [Pelovirga sp.]
MQEKMNLLRDLQEIDQEISNIEATRKGYQDELAVFATEAAEVQAMLDQLNTEIDRLRQDEAQIEQELHKKKDNVERVESRLPGIQTQKEYVAVLKEIDIAKKENKEMEDQLEEKRKEISLLVEDQQEKESALATINQNAEARGSELEELLTQSGSQLEKQTRNRDSVAADVPKNLLRKYQGLFKRRNGQALAVARNGACLGCNMQLPPQLFNQLLQGVDLQTCPHCNRILYVETEG